MDGINYIFEMTDAERKPAIVNPSLGDTTARMMVQIDSRDS